MREVNFSQTLPSDTIRTSTRHQRDGGTSQIDSITGLYQIKSYDVHIFGKKLPTKDTRQMQKAHLLVLGKSHVAIPSKGSPITQQRCPQNQPRCRRFQKTELPPQTGIRQIFYPWHPTPHIIKNDNAPTPNEQESQTP